MNIALAILLVTAPLLSSASPACDAQEQRYREYFCFPAFTLAVRRPLQSASTANQRQENYFVSLVCEGAGYDANLDCQASGPTPMRCDGDHPVEVLALAQRMIERSCRALAMFALDPEQELRVKLVSRNRRQELCKRAYVAATFVVNETCRRAALDR